MDETNNSTFIDTNEWIPIHTLPGFECCIEYYVNRIGQIKSSKGKIERILKTKRTKEGYDSVQLTQRIGRKKPIYVLVHKLVAFAFLPPPPTPYGAGKGCCVIDHKDDNKLNNCCDNLQWVSRQENNTKKPYKRRPKNTPEQVAAAKERQKIRNREWMRKKRAQQKQAKIEESNK